jgi:hypothetical protein
VLTAVPLCVPLFTAVLVHGWYIFWGDDRLACGVLPEMHLGTARLVEHCDEFEATEHLQILAQR